MKKIATEQPDDRDVRGYIHAVERNIDKRCDVRPSNAALNRLIAYKLRYKTTGQK